MPERAKPLVLQPVVGDSDNSLLSKLLGHQTGIPIQDGDPIAFLASASRFATAYSAARDMRGYRGVMLQLRIASILGAGQVRMFVEHSVDQQVWYPAGGDGGFVAVSHQLICYPGCTSGTGMSTVTSSCHVGRFMRARLDHNTGLAGDAVTAEIFGYSLL